MTLIAEMDAAPVESEPQPPARVAAPASATVYCTACGTANDADARFCKACGAKQR
jgi:hypothetical protein